MKLGECYLCVLYETMKKENPKSENLVEEANKHEENCSYAIKN